MTECDHRWEHEGDAARCRCGASVWVDTVIYRELVAEMVRLSGRLRDLAVELDGAQETLAKVWRHAESERELLHADMSAARVEEKIAKDAARGIAEAAEARGAARQREADLRWLESRERNAISRGHIVAAVGYGEVCGALAAVPLVTSQEMKNE